MFNALGCDVGCQHPLHRAPRHPSLRSGPIGPCAVLRLNLNPFLRRGLVGPFAILCSPAPLTSFS